MKNKFSADVSSPFVGNEGRELEFSDLTFESSDYIEMLFPQDMLAVLTVLTESSPRFQKEINAWVITNELGMIEISPSGKDIPWSAEEPVNAIEFKLCYQDFMLNDYRKLAVANGGVSQGKITYHSNTSRVTYRALLDVTGGVSGEFVNQFFIRVMAEAKRLYTTIAHFPA